MGAFGILMGILSNKLGKVALGVMSAVVSLLGMVAIGGAVLGLELVLSALSVSSIRLRRLLCGKPVILIENGHLLQQNLRRTRITVDELTGHLRLKDVLDLNTVQ